MDPLRGPTARKGTPPPESRRVERTHPIAPCATDGARLARRDLTFAARLTRLQARDEARRRPPGAPGRPTSSAGSAFLCYWMPSHFLSDPGKHVTDGRRKPLAAPGRRDTPVIKSACDGPQRGSAARLQLGDHRPKVRRACSCGLCVAVGPDVVPRLTSAPDRLELLVRAPNHKGL
jgi:hypothetical protein